MMANMLPTLALFLALVSKCYNHDSFAGRKQLWKPGQNTHAARITGGCLRMLENNDKENKRLREIKHDLHDVKIPESFDAREQWPNCPSIKEIRNQANCGSCWAFGSVEAMSDRTCIHSNGSVNFHFSADDLVSCCHDCGDCHGGSVGLAYDYWVNDGIVSGGAYGSHEGCRPYELPPTFKYFQYLSYGVSDGLATPKCVKECQSNYKISYEQDLHFGKTAYHVPNDVQQIQTEIMLNGPVTTGFKFYEDFMLNYTGHGIYHYTQGEQMGGHAVKIIGWGVEDGTDYWLLANSWGSGWGEKGFFKFIRGENNCGIESLVWAGIPASS